jgi:hypothetical protein
MKENDPELAADATEPLKDGADPGADVASTAFTSAFLERLHQLEDSPGALEAELTGPWSIRPLATGGYGVFRSWEAPELGDEPRWRLADPCLAELTAALLPLVGRPESLYLRPSPEDEGYALERNGEICGHTRIFDRDFVDALDLVIELCRQPEALARLLENAGPTVLELVGRRLQRGPSR